MGKLCQTCGLENPDVASACKNCGTSFSIDESAAESQTPPCESCGSPNPLAATVCEFCGTPLKNFQPQSPLPAQARISVAPFSQTPPVLKPDLTTPAPAKPQSQKFTPAKPVSIKKKGKSHAKSIIASIFYAVFCLGFFGLLLYLILLLVPAP